MVVSLYNKRAINPEIPKENYPKVIEHARFLSMIDIGASAPDFTLPASTGGEVTLSSFRGNNNVLLVFYPLAFTPV